MKYLLQATAIAAFFGTSVFAEIFPHQHGTGDQRITHFHFKDGDVYRVELNFRFITEIRFERGETVTNIQLGDSVGFQVTRLGSGEAITVKPVDPIGVTNMNVETNKRRYTFLLNAGDAEDIAQNFRVTFKYPGTEQAPPSFVDLTSGTKVTGRFVNSDYLLGGDADFAPFKVYDDGVNTWIQYRATARRPAIFSVNKMGEEGVVNYTAHPNHWIQVHGLSNQWVLRIDDEEVCIHKENKIY